MTAHDPPRVHAFAAVAVGGALGALFGVLAEATLVRDPLLEELV